MIGNLFRTLAGGERRATFSKPSAGWDGVDMLAGARSSTGVSVTPQSSLSNTTVLACVSLIARTLASVPLTLYQRDGRVRNPAPDHAAYELLHDMANPLQTAMEVRETWVLNALLWGNGYLEVEWDEAGNPLGLWPMASDRVGVEITRDKQLIYTYWSDEFGQLRLPGWRVAHLRDMTTSGLVGISRIRAAMNAVGLAIATEQFGSRYFADGAAPSMVLVHPSRLSPEAMANMRRSFEVQWSGLSNAHRIAVLGEGVKPEQFQVRADEAQFLETRAFQVEEICRLYNVAPGLVGAAQTQTYASAEQDMIRFRELALGPWAEALEKRLGASLLTKEERKQFYFQHKLAKLQATDLKTRYETYSIAKQSRVLTSNEIREMEDLNPLEGGDVLDETPNLAPDIQRQDSVDSQPDNQVDSDTDTEGGGAAANSRRRWVPAAPLPWEVYDAWVAETARRFKARVANDVRSGGAKALRKGGKTALDGWIAEMRSQWNAAGLNDLQPLLRVWDTEQPQDRVQEWIDTELALREAEIVGDIE